MLKIKRMVVHKSHCKREYFVSDFVFLKVFCPYCRGLNVLFFFKAPMLTEDEQHLTEDMVHVSEDIFYQFSEVDHITLEGALE